MKQGQVKQTIDLSPDIFHLLYLRAHALGVSIPDYIIYLAINDAQKEYREELDEETLEDVRASLEEIKQGRYTLIDPTNPNALIEFLKV